MKDKILYLILGILIGAVITAGCFLVFSKNAGPEMKGERPEFGERGDRRMSEDGNFIKPDKMIDEENLPEKPQENNSQADDEV